MRKTGWRELRKRLLALGIAAVMIGNTVDLSALPVLAQEQSFDVEEEKAAVLAEDSQSEKENAVLAGDSENTGDSDDSTKNLEHVEESTDSEKDPKNVEESADPAKDSENQEKTTEETTSESEDVSEDESELEKSNDVEVQEQSGEDGIALMADSAVAEADGQRFSTLQEAFKYAWTVSRPTIKLLDNVTLDERVYPESGCTATLDLNGKTVSRKLKEDMVTGKDGSVFLVESGAMLTIKDTAGGGYIEQSNICPAVTVNGGNVTIESGTIKATSADANENRAIEISSGTVTINGGVIEGAQIGVCTWGGSKLTVNGGSINGGTSYALLVKGGDVKLYGGTYNTDAMDDYSIWNENGTAASLLASASLTYMTDDGEESEISTNEKGVKGKTTVKTAPERVAYIEQGGVEKSRTDCKEITSADTASLSDGWYVVKENTEVENLDITSTDVNLILGDGATLRVKEQIKSSTGGNPDQNLLKIYLQGGGTGVLVAEKGHDAKTLNIGKKGTPMKMANSEGEPADARYYYTISKCDHSKVDYKSNETYHGGACVYCGTFVEGKHTFTWAYKDENTHTGNCTACGYVKEEVHDKRYIMNSDGLTHQETCAACHFEGNMLPHSFDENGKCTGCYAKAAAQIGDKIYTSLPAALNAVADGGTVKLLANYTTDENDLSTLIFIKKMMTLDLNGCAIDRLTVGQTWNLSAGTKLETPISGDLTIKDSGLGSVGRVPDLEIAKGTLTIEGGEIGTKGDTASFVCSDEFGEVNIKGGVVWYFGCEGGTANITGGKVFDLSVRSTDNSQPVVNISGGTNHGGWNDGSEEYDSAIWSVNDGTLNISGGTFGKICFSYIGGAVDIDGGVFGAIANTDGNKKIPLLSLLNDGYAFFGKDAEGKYTVLKDGTAEQLEDVKVLAHKHIVDENGKCECGFVCTHDSVDADKNCTTCGIAIVASAAAGGKTTYHVSIAAALEAAKDNGTVTVIAKEKTVTLPDKNGYAVLYAEGTITLDLNGHTLNGGSLAAGGYIGSSFNTREGNLTVKDTTGGGAIGLYVAPGANVKFDVEASVTCLKLAAYNAVNQPATVKFYGGVIHEIFQLSGFTCADLLAEGYCFYNYDESTSKVGDAVKLSELEGKTKVTTPLAVVKCSHPEAGDDGKCIYCGGKLAVRDNNDNIYDTLQAAINAAIKDSDIEWIQMDANMTENVVFDAAGKAVTLKMNGKMLTCADGIPLTVKNGTLTIADAADIAQTGETRDTLDCAISITGGKLIFGGNLIAKGGSFNGNGNLPAQEPAVYAEGGELDFQGGLDLKGGLTVTGNAKLTNGLTQGIFSAENGIDAKRISVEGSSNYKHVEELLASGYTFVDKNDTSKFPCANASYEFWTGDVTIIPHTHTWGPEPGELYACTVCGKTCAHLDGYKTGKCEVCGKPCPHAIADQSPKDYNYYCNECGEQMFARIQTDTYKWLHFTNLVDAMNAAEDGQTIVLLSDINQGEQRAAVVGDGKTVTLDLKNHTITNGYISVGKSSQYTSSTLKIIGTGSFVRTGKLGNLTVYPGGTLDLSEWTGGTISELDILDDSNADEALRKQTSFMVGQKAGTIGLLWIMNWQLGAVDTAKAINLGGGSYGTLRIGGRTADQISLGNLLESGYAFKYTSGDGYVLYDRKLTEKQDGIGDINYVSVVSCAHGGTKGFEINADICSYCKIAPAVAKAALTNVGSDPWRNFASLQNAIDAKRKDGSAITLLADVDGDYTVNTETAFDLSGHMINGKVTVNNANVTFSNSGSNGTIKNVVMSGSNAKFGTSSAPAIIDTLTVEDGATLKSILPFRYGYKVFDGDSYSWYDETVTGTYLTKVSVTELPFSARNLFLKVKGEEVTEVERGMTVQLCAQVDTAGVDQMIFYIKKAEDGTTLVELRDDEVTYKKDGTNCYYVAEYTFKEMGDYLISFIAEKDRYQGQSSDKSLTVTRVSVPVNAITAPTGVGNLIYNGSEQPLIREGKVDDKYGTMQYSLDGQIWSTSIPCGGDARTYTVYYKVEGNNDYKDSEVMNLTVTIAPKTVTEPAIELNGDMIYTGSEIRPAVTVKDGETIIPDTEYEVIFTDNTNAGTATVTIEDKTGGNYTVNGSTTFTIGKADSKITTAPTANTLTYNGEEQALITAGIADGGTMQYRLGDSGDFGIDIPKAVNAGTYTIYYKAAGDSNHNDVTDMASVTVTIAKADQQALCITSDTTVVYGQTLQMTTTGGTGIGVVTYSIDQNNSTGEAKIDGSTGVLTPVKVGTVKVTATKAEDLNHNAITSEEVDITITKAMPAGEPKYTRITTSGKTLADAGLTLTGSSLNPDAGTLEWVDRDGNALPDNTRVEANKTYKWRFTPEDNNYDILTGEVELYHVTSGSGSSGSKHHHSSSGGSGNNAGSTGKTTPTLPTAPAETPKTGLSTVKLPGTKTETQKPADETGAREPHIADDTGKSGWDLIKKELQDVLKDALQENENQTGDTTTVTVNMNGATVVPGDIFDSIKRQDIDVVFDMGDGITWTVNGLDITADQVNDIDFSVTMGTDAGQTIPVDVINNVIGERYSMNLSLTYDGAFGFQAVLTVNMDQKNAGLYANLFYYNEESGELEFICAGEIGSDGNVDLTFSHASDYVVVIDAQPMDVANAADTDVDAADTTDDAQQAGAADVVSDQNSGNMIWMVLLVIAVLLAGTGIMLVQKGKKKEK